MPEDVKVPKGFIQNTISAWLVCVLIEQLEQHGLDDLITIVILYSWCFAYCAEDGSIELHQDAPEMLIQCIQALEKLGVL